MSRYCLFLMMFVAFVWGQSFSADAGVSTLVADTKSGFIIESKEAALPRPPASLTKLMTLYLTFGALESGLLTMDQALPISEHAAAQPKSKIYVRAGDTITVREAILALIIKSANDVAVVVAEALAPSEEDFADLMTRTAQSLGLTDTVFKNASGLHVPGQVTTARDMAVLTMALIEHYPQYYDLFSTPSFSYKGQKYGTHNIVLQQYEGAEGLKTGFVSAVGYNIISTAKQGDTRLVSVVIGDESPLKRDLRAMRLLDKGFHQVAVQRRAEATGRLKAPFNPLNRKAFIARPPAQMYVPIMEASLKQTKSRAMIALNNPKPVETKLAQAPRVLDTSIEQGDSWAIQVGAFEGRDKARQIAQKALTVLGISNKEIQTPKANNQFFRSRILGFSNKDEAFKACKLLQNQSWQCFLVSPQKGS